MNLFKKITIQTPESVELEFTLAGIGNRTLALIIDYLLLLSLLLVLGLVAAFLREGLIGLAISLGNNSENTELWSTAIFLLVATTIYSGYFVIFEAWWQGQTPGKRFAKIRVIKDNGKPEGAFQAALRALMRPVDDILFIGYLCIVFGRKEKRIGDWLAGTLVIQAERSSGNPNLAIPQSAQNLAEQLIEQSSVGNLLPDDFAMLREYLQRRVVLTRKARQEISVKLASQVREIIKLENLPEEQMPAEAFLEAVYWAYQKQCGDRRIS